MFLPPTLKDINCSTTTASSEQETAEHENNERLNNDVSDHQAATQLSNLFIYFLTILKKSKIHR